MPADMDEAEIAAFLLVEYGAWPYAVPLFELPPEIGLRVMELLQRQTSHKNRMLTQLLWAVQTLDLKR